jgi:hypothetical protein
MAENSTVDDASAKLAEAIREVIRETGGPTASQEAAGGATPSLANAFFLVLLIANLAFLISLVPSHWMEGPHWDLLKEAIPAIGGSLFVVTTSWYKDWTLRMCGRRSFRISQAALSLVFAFSLWVPWLHIHPQIEPLDAQIFVDDEKEARDVSKPMWLSMKPHSFAVEWTPWSAEPKESRTRNFQLSWRELLHAAFWSEQPRWAMCYKVRFISESTPGIKVRIVPDKQSRFDREFLKNDLAEHSLQSEPDGSLVYSLPSTEDMAGATQLPAGHYIVTPIKSGCKEGTSKPLVVNHDSDKSASFPLLQCGQ